MGSRAKKLDEGTEVGLTLTAPKGNVVNDGSTRELSGHPMNPTRRMPTGCSAVFAALVSTRRCSRLGLAVLGVVFFGLAVPAVAYAQAAQVTGIVRDENNRPVPGANVRLTGHPSQTTNAAGRFHFFGVAPGTYVLTTFSVGYDLSSQDFTVVGDTTVAIRMRRRSITLDTVRITPRSVRIRGVAVDSATGDPLLLPAEATVYPGGKTIGANTGRFAFDSVPAGPVTIVVEATEHLPRILHLEALRDTSVVVRMAVDSVALRMIAVQVGRLAERAAALPMPTTSLNRDAIKRENALTVNELLNRRLHENPASTREQNTKSADEGCFFLDDMKVSRGVFDGVVPELVERIEIYRMTSDVPTFRGRSSSARNLGSAGMVRVYTKRYVATLARRGNLQRIMYMTSGLRRTCN